MQQQIGHLEQEPDPAAEACARQEAKMATVTWRSNRGQKPRRLRSQNQDRQQRLSVQERLKENRNLAGAHVNEIRRFWWLTALARKTEREYDSWPKNNSGHLAPKTETGKKMNSSDRI
jgi:hypothetical protein